MLWLIFVAIGTRGSHASPAPQDEVLVTLSEALAEAQRQLAQLYPGPS